MADSQDKAEEGKPAQSDKEEKEKKDEKKFTGIVAIPKEGETFEEAVTRVKEENADRKDEVVSVKEAIAFGDPDIVATTFPKHVQDMLAGKQPEAEKQKEEPKSDEKPADDKSDDSADKQAPKAGKEPEPEQVKAEGGDNEYEKKEEAGDKKKKSSPEPAANPAEPPKELPPIDADELIDSADAIQGVMPSKVEDSVSMEKPAPAAGNIFAGISFQFRVDDVSISDGVISHAMDPEFIRYIPSDYSWTNPHAESFDPEFRRLNPTIVNLIENITIALKLNDSGQPPEVEYDPDRKEYFHKVNIAPFVTDTPSGSAFDERNNKVYLGKELDHNIVRIKT